MTRGCRFLQRLWKITETIKRVRDLTFCLTEYNEKVFIDGIKEEGKNERAKELAVDMLSDNKPIDEILKYSRLEPEALKEVADSMNITVTIPGV